MIIDDEPITLEMVQAFLEEAGYTNFILVEKSTEAMEHILNSEPDILLLDLMMPEVSGYDILTQVRELPKLRYLPIIILTAATDTESKLRALDLGATDFLAKPVDPSELSLRVRNTLAAKSYLDKLSYYDPVTNLPNKKMFFELLDKDLKKAKRYDEKMALLNIELDHFDRITDTMEISTGDEVLRQITRRIEKVVRDVDLLGPPINKDDKMLDLFRFSSSVFSLLLYKVNEAVNGALVSKRILEEIRKPVSVGDREIYVTASIGITTYPDDGDSCEELLRLASSAKDFAKNKGGNTFQFSSDEINAIYEKRHILESKLRKALARQELVLFYQPRVKIATNTIDGVEALVRWDGRQEFMLPGEFIPLAEEIGLIIPFGEWILNEACTQLKKWHQEGKERISMAVNLSAKQFTDPDFFPMVQRIVAKSGIDPQFLKLELTESLLLGDIENKIIILQNLKDMGLKISVDDFGTGYSSLSYLSKLPVDELKIDKSFTSDLPGRADSRAIVSTIIYLARNLGLLTVAEGVETMEQLDFLQQEGCDLYQGFLFSKPVSSTVFSELFNSDRNGNRGVSTFEKHA
ncbi:MAG: hypothetical protein AMJ60_08945 [Desulfobacterales bacterium SG8_35]|nr:MAG: hypothetical protein AMJ60_08945 [Desulfobacterales bacterium SG8_35]